MTMRVTGPDADGLYWIHGKTGGCEGAVSVRADSIAGRAFAGYVAPATPPEAAADVAHYGTLGTCDLRSGSALHQRTTFCTNWRPATAPERGHGWCENPNCKGGCGCTQTGVCACQPPATAKDEEP